MYKYPLDIVVEITKAFRNIVDSKLPHLLENPKMETFFGYVNDKGEKFYYDNPPSDNYLNSVIKYEDYQKSIFLTDYHGNKYVIRIDCLEDLEKSDSI
ncbi:MAG: hypothetical protein CBD62_00980 [Candidatus Pelagibacter sp. TMED202]|nr:MAG: hypothetical protein CBD62_00980 [Candidatus Pelagibacter sp. TMED202]|tara:strand:+ start:3909 stop:4202 length:294 start_codon:yes stop_codon:yes gene_type:complete